MRKLSILIGICLLPMLVAAQMSPEAIVGMRPSWPSLSDVIVYCSPLKNEIISPTIENYKTAVNEANVKIDEQFAKLTQEDGIAVNAKADEVSRRELGMSLEQAQNMSDAQTEKIAESKANSMFSKFGVKDMFAKKKKMNASESEQMAEEISKNMTGMSQKELKAFEKMSESEQVAYLQQGNRMKNIVEKSGNLKGISQQKVDREFSDKLQELTPKREKSMQRIKDVYEKIAKYKYDLEKQFEKTWLKDYAPAVERLRKQNDEESENRILALYRQFFASIVPQWFDFCGESYEKYMSLSPDAEVVDEYNEMMAKSMESVPNAMTFRISLARDAFNVHTMVLDVLKTY